MKDNIKIIRDYFRLVKGSKIHVILLFISSISANILSLLIPVFASNIVYYVTISNADKTYLNVILLGITYVIYNLFWYLNYVSYSYNFKYSYMNLREKVIDKIFTYDLDFHNKLSKGTILNTVGLDISYLSEMIDSICEIIVVFTKLIILIIIFLKTNIWIGLLVLVLEFIYLKSFDYCNVMTAKHLRTQHKYRDKLTDNLSQILNGLSEIKLFNLYNKIKNNFYIIANKWSDKYMKKRKYMNIKYSLLPFITDLGKVLLYAVLVYFVLKGQYKVNLLILLITYFENIMSNTKELMEHSSILRERAISITRLEKLLYYTNEFNLEFGSNETDSISGLIELKNVSFSYKTLNKGNINNISFKILPNEITALVGHSGSGKTTITNLILRKYKIDKGCILIDGDDIYSYSKGIYCKNVVGVNQSPFIFNMSIKKNLSLIDPDEKHQIEACKRVGIHDYIMSLPKGYNTILGDNATNFSGGQRQLLSIARTLLSKAEVIIFDEVTSSLDPMLVEKIKGIFDNLKLDHTIIIVTHKKDVMKMADKIVVLNKGNIVGIGSHDELMKDNEYYIDLQTNNYSSSNKKIDGDIFISEGFVEKK